MTQQEADRLQQLAAILGGSTNMRLYVQEQLLKMVADHYAKPVPSDPIYLDVKAEELRDPDVCHSIVGLILKQTA